MFGSSERMQRKFKKEMIQMLFVNYIDDIGKLLFIRIYESFFYGCMLYQLKYFPYVLILKYYVLILITQRSSHSVPLPVSEWTEIVYWYTDNIVESQKSKINRSGTRVKSILKLLLHLKKNHISL